MGLCDLPSDNTIFVFLAYIGALLPWGLLPLVDPLGRNWITFTRARYYVIGYFLISLIPYGSLIPYALLQLCSEQEADRKELFMAVVTILISFINSWRAWRGVLALVDVRDLWQAVEVKTMQDYLQNDISYDIVEYVNQHLPKSLARVSVSNYLVDNDFPGEAPRAIYSPRFHVRNSYPLPYLKVTVLDTRERMCMYALWTIWMLTNPITRHTPITFPDLEDPIIPGVMASSIPGRSTAVIEDGDGVASETPEVDDPNAAYNQLQFRSGALAVAFRSAYSLQNVIQDFDNPFLLAIVLAGVLRHGTTLRNRQPFARIRIRQRRVRGNHRRLCFKNRRQNKHDHARGDNDGEDDVNPFTFETVGSITSDILGEQRSKLPLPADNSLGWVTPGIAQKWAVHLELNRAGLKSLNSRITAALGLPSCCGGLIQRWWRGPPPDLETLRQSENAVDNERSRSNDPTRLWKRAAYATVIAILEFHRRPGNRPSNETDRRELEERLDYIIQLIDFLIQKNPITYVPRSGGRLHRNNPTLISRRTERARYEIRNKDLLHHALKRDYRSRRKLHEIKYVGHALRRLKTCCCLEINRGTLLKRETQADEERPFVHQCSACGANRTNLAQHGSAETERFAMPAQTARLSRASPQHVTEGEDALERTVSSPQNQPDTDLVPLQRARMPSNDSDETPGNLRSGSRGPRRRPRRRRRLPPLRSPSDLSFSGYSTQIFSESLDRLNQGSDSGTWPHEVDLRIPAIDRGISRGLRSPTIDLLPSSEGENSDASATTRRSGATTATRGDDESRGREPVQRPTVSIGRRASV